MGKMWDSDSEESYGSGSLLFDDTPVNPATGLPMVGGFAGIDLAGNPYGDDHGVDFNLDDWKGFSLGDLFED